VAAQTEHVQAARANPELRASSNHGKPPVAATPKPGDFRGSGVVAAREGGAVHGQRYSPRRTGTRIREIRETSQRSCLSFELGRACGNRVCASSWPTWPTASSTENVRKLF